MPLATTASMIEVLEQAKLLNGPQLEEVKKLKSGPPQQLAQAIVQRGWLTSFQAKQVLNGRGADLVLGPYLILESLGQGGTGQVFKARHLKLNRVVALKALRPELVKDQQTVQRFYREIEVASQVSHPNIVHSFEAGLIGTVLALVMEHVAGPDLERLVQEKGPLQPALAAEYIRQAAVGLQHAHERGLIHRDIKPSNLLLTQSPSSASAQGEAKGSGTVKILDLGLARLQEPTQGSKTANLTIVSGAGVMQGTPDFMAPEQALDFHSADIRADIYSLGCTLYFLLAGRPPFAGGKTLAEKLMKHQQAEPPLAELKLPPGLDSVLRKMMAKRPPDRYQTPAELAEALAPFSSGSLARTADDIKADTKHSDFFREPYPPPERRRKSWPWLLGAGVAGILLLAGGLAFFSGRPDDLPLPHSQTISPLATAAPRPEKITAFKEKFQGPKPAAGWQYLWNAHGPIGNPANYVPLIWAGQSYSADGDPKLPRSDPAAYLHLAGGGGHPGRGAKQTKGIDHCAIAAYTVQPADGAGDYRIASSSIAGGNGLGVIVHVNSQAPALAIDVPRQPNPPLPFDCGLGALKPGDTIYVAVSPKGDDAYDTFNLDFAIHRGMTPVVVREVLIQEGFEGPEIHWDKRGQAAFTLDTDQPHQGKQSCRISVADNAPLSYQQVQRIVDDKAMAGDIYLVRFWVRSQDVKAEPGAYGYIEFLNSRGSRVGLIHSRVNLKNGAKGWEQLSINATAPKDCARVRVGLVINSHGTAWFDDVDVIRERKQ